MEAMALELPVIAINENGPLEIVTHGHDGLLVRPNAPDELAQQMTRVFRDANCARVWAKTGARRCKKNFISPITPLRSKSYTASSRFSF